MNITLTLETPAGPFVFTGAEAPQHIAHGGSQALSRDRLIGGRKIVRALGPDESDISFSGIFAYQGTARSDFLDSLRRRGDVCTLTWDNRRMLVIISEYQPDYHKPYQIGYSITFCVVSNETALLDSVPAVTPAQQLKSDLATLNQKSACLANPVLAGISSTITGALTAMQGVMQPIAGGLQPISSTIGAAAQCADQIANQIETATAAVAAPIAQLLANTQALITNTETAINEAATFGGIVPGNPVALSVGKYMTQLNQVTQLPAIYEIQSVGYRMQSNLALSQSAATPKTVTVGGGTLYDVAAAQYGDGAKWQTIAAANNLTDPALTGIQTLTIPAA
ncbi:MAG: hypothetical protein ACYC4K_01240 [Thiobacillus sp.]